MRKPLLDEGSWCYLKGVTPLVIAISVIFTLLLWLIITVWDAYGAERQERSVPYDRAKEFSTSMLYYPEQPMVEWELGPYLDFIEGGNAAATPKQWAEALHRKGKIDAPDWAKARAYLTTLKWQKNTTKEWWRMWRVLRPYGKWQAGRLDSGYERAFEAGEWGLHDPATGELIVAGDCGNVVVEKLSAPIAAAPVTPRPQPSPAPPKVAEAPPAAQPAPPPAPEPSRVAAPPQPPPAPTLPTPPTPPTVETTRARQTAPAVELQTYFVNVVSDPTRKLIEPGQQSRDIGKVEGKAQRLLDSGEVTRTSGGRYPQPFLVTFYDWMGKPFASYEVYVQNGKGWVRMPRAEVCGGKTWFMRMIPPEELWSFLRYPESKVLRWSAQELCAEPEMHGWFVLEK